MRGIAGEGGAAAIKPVDEEAAAHGQLLKPEKDKSKTEKRATGQPKMSFTFSKKEELRSAGRLS